MSTHEAIAPSSGRAAIVDDAGRGELYVSVYEDGREVAAPHLAQEPPGEALRIAVADYLQERNVAVACARRAMEIVARGDAERYRDITPVYVRLAEAEVKLQQRQ
jgi:tRNA A37 threonylcarbamoyladenosine modification protein TsaB